MLIYEQKIDLSLIPKLSNQEKKRVNSNSLKSINQHNSRSRNLAQPPHPNNLKQTKKHPNKY